MKVDLIASDPWTINSAFIEANLWRDYVPKPVRLKAEKRLAAEARSQARGREVVFHGTRYPRRILADQMLKGADGLASLKEAELELGRLPDTFTVATPSGGEHRYFSVPKGTGLKNSASELGPGVDVRANGGYVVAPGSELVGKGWYKTTRHLRSQPCLRDGLPGFGNVRTRATKVSRPAPVQGRLGLRWKCRMSRARLLMGSQPFTRK